MKPVIHPMSEKLLVAICNKFPQSLLVTGDVGVGLSTIGRYIAELRRVKPMVILPEKDEKIDIEKGIIGVDSMRRLLDDVRTKTSGDRIVIIDYAERMTHQAQNAFLKLLEEPSENTYYILVSSSVSKLLPTITSRTECLTIRPVTIEQSNELLDSLGVTDAVKRSQLLFMGGGRPAELYRLTNNNDYFASRSESVRDARELLRGTVYQKLLIAHKYKDNRSMVLTLLLDVSNILKRSIITNPNVDTIKKINSILDSYTIIQSNGNIRLCLARIIL